MVREDEKSRAAWQGLKRWDRVKGAFYERRWPTLYPIGLPTANGLVKGAFCF